MLLVCDSLDLKPLIPSSDFDLDDGDHGLVTRALELSFRLGYFVLMNSGSGSGASGLTEWETRLFPRSKYGADTKDILQSWRQMSSAKAPIDAFDDVCLSCFHLICDSDPNIGIVQGSLGFLHMLTRRSSSTLVS